MIKDADITELVENLTKLFNESGVVILDEPADHSCIIEKDSLFYLVIDGQTLSQNANIAKIFVVWVQSFHVFNVEYPNSLRKTLQHFD